MAKRQIAKLAVVAPLTSEQPARDRAVSGAAASTQFAEITLIRIRSSTSRRQTRFDFELSCSRQAEEGEQIEGYFGCLTMRR